VFIINVTYCIVCIVGQSLCFVVQWRRWSQCRVPPLHCWQPLRASLVCLLNANWDASSVADCAICSRPCWPIGPSTRPVGNRRDCFAAKIVKLSSPAWSRYKSAVTSQLNAAFVEPSLKQRSGRCSSDTRWRRWLLAASSFTRRYTGASQRPCDERRPRCVLTPVYEPLRQRTTFDLYQYAASSSLGSTSLDHSRCCCCFVSAPQTWFVHTCISYPSNISIFFSVS